MPPPLENAAPQPHFASSAVASIATARSSGGGGAGQAAREVPGLGGATTGTLNPQYRQPQPQPPPQHFHRLSQVSPPRRDSIAHHYHQHQHGLSQPHNNPSASALLAAVNGAPAHNHHRPSTARSPTASPQRRNRPRSPQPHVSSVAAPQVPSLPLLSSAAYTPNTSKPASGTSSPSAHHQPNFSSSSGADYFNSKPQPPPNARRPPSRTGAEKVLGRSPLGSPPIGVLESEARYHAAAPSCRAAAPGSSTTAGAKDPAFGAGVERPDSKDKTSRVRSESSASVRVDDGHQGTPPRTRDRKERDKKTMLSRALQKANTAVLLDSAQNFEGAMEAYWDACRLLQQVMIRSHGEEDRRKLDAIRATYTTRIEELRRLDIGYPPMHGKSLPARPMSNESLDEQRSMLFADNDDEHVVIETATVTRIVNDRPIDDPEPPVFQPPALLAPEIRAPRESVITTAIREVESTMPTASSFLLQPTPGASEEMRTLGSPLESPMDRNYMPPPLSPRRPLSPNTQEPTLAASNTLLPPKNPYKPLHKRVNSSESTSWLDTIDESGGSSCSSSVHSFSPDDLRNKHISNGSNGTEAEFDAALDAAVEAAYDDGYEPYDDEEQDSTELIATRLKNVELAKERVREAEREEMIAAAKYKYAESQDRNQALPHVRESSSFNFQEEEDEDERLLDEMTREYMLDGFDFDLQTKSSLPRQSDSSNFSGSTYHSSLSSHRTTGGTSLSTVAEVLHQAHHRAPSQPPPSVPSASIARPPSSDAQPTQDKDAPQTTPAAAGDAKETVSVRSRRLSGQVAKALKIETALPPVPPAPHTDKPVPPVKEPLPDVPPPPKTAATTTFPSAQLAADANHKLPPLPPAPLPSGLRAPSPQPPGPSPADAALTVSPAPPAVAHSIPEDATLAPGSPKTSKAPVLSIRKNKSSLSLKQRALSISSPDGSDASIGTPLSTTFSFPGVRKPSIAGPITTPSIPTFPVDGLPSGGVHLFDSDIHTPYSPGGAPSTTITNAPIPLEPCPESYLLRPFWLMRCIYQTIAHPRGGYLSTKLFIPRDVWRVKNVKIKNTDDKIANCDLLTAALQRLATVDTLDADAVLEEMQALEVVLDQVQAQLAKKLGNEVGVHSTATLFKDASTVGVSAGSSEAGANEKGSHGSQDHALPSSVLHKTASTSSVQGTNKYLASWRKLRSKNSAVGLSGLVSSAAKSNEVDKESLSMPTLPMTGQLAGGVKFVKRDLSALEIEGVNKGYMGSLARLCDACQVLDQIARQVEDPGLKHSSPTHVGLELSARHAAEFFGFYICRFVLGDLALLLDKFVKRGSEWVLV